MARGAMINEPEFRRLKELTRTDMTIAQAAMVSRRSKVTISRIKKSESYEDYKQIVSTYNYGSNSSPIAGFEVYDPGKPKKRKARVNDVKEMVDAIERMYETLRNINALAQQIADQLGC